ncbi:basic leucine zipper transcriptional factor ATF-like 3 isoform X2 [Rhinatrema bivittatum]|uniref:basic leucine zipper transcriptional factor ATF-like 3 isoform X2 n=1 Tax=Rhinatrema bivittatum TaxID=194408 RepID=UPI00112C8E9A|nr:basic leucine zipper transcriptional factor ATF-like 3 isoform X2 [Rhinatrema bivittatum]
MCPALRLPLPRPLPAALSWSSGMSHLAASDSRRGSTSSSEQDLQTQSPSSDRKVRRREKNRVAAQRSRKKQTQKADKLHEEYEGLEQENTSLRKEIGKLTEEVKHLSEVLRAHEQICPLLLCPVNLITMPRGTEAAASCLPR